LDKLKAVSGERWSVGRLILQGFGTLLIVG